jgi:predicted DNA-binding antitoxin AbrB/MazE fold protein
MSMQVDAVYEHGMLKPLQPLDRAENEHVSLLVTPTARTSGGCQADVEFTESLRCALQDGGPVPGLEEVRRRLSKIPETLTADFIAEREDR